MKSSFFLIFSLILGCASFEKIGVKILPQDTYSRIYDLSFADFHPQLNSFFQEYARQHKGNSFQIRRLGKGEVIWRGVFKIKNSSEIFKVEITCQPSGPKKSKLEIRFIDDRSAKTSGSWEKASANFFQVVEESLKISPEY